MTTRSDIHPAHEEPFQGPRQIFRTLRRIVSLQIQIVMLKIKNALFNACMATTLIAAAWAMAVIALIFLEIGFFQLLTDIGGLRVVWAALIFSGVHLIAAALLGLAAKRFISKTFSNSQGGSHEKR
jgi:hypothetical protein